MPIQLPSVVSCETWGAVPARRTVSVGVPHGIVLHHTDTPSRDPGATAEAEMALAARLAKSIQREHMTANERHPAGIDSLQNFTISRGGLILEGRHTSLEQAIHGHLAIGGATKNPTANHTMQNIEIEGTYTDPEWEQKKPTEVQLAAIVELCAWLSFWGNFDSSAIQTHREVQPGHGTDCPGHILDLVPTIIQKAHDRKVEIEQAHGLG